MDRFQNIFMSPRLWMSVAAIVIGVIIWIFIKKILIKQLDRFNLYKAYQKNTHVFLNIIKICWCIFVFLVLMRINGIELKTLTAGLGITGIVVGFALQDLLKDWIMGISVIVDDYYGVGDIVEVNGVTGEVIKLSLKTTKIRDLAYGNIVSFSNRNVDKVHKISNSVDTYIPVPYDMDKAAADALVAKVIRKCGDYSTLAKAHEVGVSEFASHAIMVLLCAEATDISKRSQAKRDMNNAIREVFAEEGIEIPHMATLLK